MEQKDITNNSQEAESKSEYAQGSEAEVLETAKREDRNTMPYISASSCNPIGALVPTKLAYETIEALNRFIGKGIDTAELVREKLGYKSKLDVCNAFASEQVDAIALAIVQIESGKGFILGDMAGIGKGRSQPLESKILTPTGWKTMGDMRIGSKVITSDGSTTKVVGIYPQGKIDVYKISFSDGTSTECSADHLWSVKKGWQKDHIKKQPNSKACDWSVMTTEEIQKKIKQKLEIPITQPVEFKKSKTSIDPYLLGVLLGDACIRDCGIELTSADSEILDSVSAVIDEKLSLKNTRKYHYQITKKTGRFGVQTNPLLIELRELGLTGKTAKTKFIPENYKINSIDVRLSILQGLMDTDGYVNKDGSAMYYSVSDKLADDVSFIVQSLGGTTTRGIKKTNRLDCHVVYIKLPNNFKPFRLSRKLERLKDRVKYFPSRIIRSVEKIGQKECQCIQVEHKSHLYLTDNLIVTHNTVAGICRYAKREGKVPIFSTIGANLFTDIYRDFNDIGGLTGSPMLAGSRNNIDLPVPFILNTDNSGIINQEIGEEVVQLFKPFSPKDTKDFCDLKTMPLNTDMVLMTYSQLNQDVDNAKNGNAISKFNFLKAIAPNSILVLDESHKGAGDGNIGENLTELIALSSGVMFASATYSKVPKSMMLYIPKTDIKESKIRPSTIVDAVSENGEAVQEYIASLLVKGGQMIRRERTFDNCKIDYNYMKADVQKYYGLYDKVMTLYNEIEAFSKSTLYKEAVEKAIERIAKENKVTLVGKDNPKPSRKDEKTEWMEDNKTKYQPNFNPTNLVKSRFQWIENLLFSIKADYVAQETINLLNSREVRNEDGHLVPNYVEYTIGTKKEKVLTNFKPIICVRNTAESSMNGLGYSVGRRLTKEENDYAKTLVNIAQSLMSSKMTFRPVNESRKPIIIEKADILNEDFTDNGVRVAEIIKKMNEATSGLPLSPIDAMIEKIQSVKRQNWDDKYTSSEYYVVEEITKRSKKIVSTADGGFEIVPIKKEAVTNKTSRFNSGKSDVVILNTSGSTGISMHSKWDFIDRRPRVMLIHQVELDVATEVQKRGRVNRTGQVNNPAYSYVVSAIPSEVRKLMMLRRKLRSLDANTTGNVKQSAKASQILDKEGNEIEDMSNKYGYECLMDFVKEAGNERFFGLVADEWYEDAKSPEDKFETYLREVEKLPCADQEDFYNRMNSNYIKLKNRLIEADEWDLDTTIEDLKTSTLNKKILYQGNDDNEFTKSVYIEDKYITPKGKPYTKEELEDRIIELAKTKDLTKYHNDLLDEFDAYMSAEVEKIVISLGDADISNATTEEEKTEIIEAHKEMVNNAVIEAKYKFDSVRRRLIYFKPNKIVQYPLNTDLLYLGAFDQNGNRIPVSYDGGKFVGFKFLSKSDNKFSKMNIELHFASTSRAKPHLKVTLTKQYEGILDWIMNPSGHGGKILTDEQLARVNNWTLASRGERDRMRVFTGELFKSFEMADDIFKVDGNYEKKKRLIKYTTTAGTVETGIKLWQKRFIPLTEGTTPLFTSVNSTAFKTKINDLYTGRTAWLPSMNEFFTKNYNGTLFFCVCTGKTTPKAKRIDKIYLSKLSDPTILEEMHKEIGITPITKEFNIEMYSSGSAEKFRAIEFKVFELNPSRLEKLLIYLDRKFSFLVQVNTEGAESEFIVRDLPDMFDAKAKEGEEAGIFDYYLTTTFDDKKLPPNYIDGSFKETPENDYGMVSLRYPLNVVEASIFKVFPANITKSQAVKNILNAIKDDESRLKFIEEVKTLGEDYGAVSELAQQVVGINPRYAIGKVGLKYAGKVISDYIKNPVEDEAKIEVQEIDEKTPLDFDSAQDFIIKLKSLL